MKTEKISNLKVGRLWQVAVHEAGHALAQWYFCLGLKKVSIVPDETSLGRVMGGRISSEDVTHVENRQIFEDREAGARTARFHARIVTSLAGMTAERLLAPNRHVSAGGRGDMRNVDEILQMVCPENEVRVLYRWVEARAKNLVEKPVHRKMIEDMAEALMCAGEMNGRDAKAVLLWSLDRHTLAPNSFRMIGNRLPAWLDWTDDGFAMSATRRPRKKGPAQEGNPSSASGRRRGDS